MGCSEPKAALTSSVIGCSSSQPYPGGSSNNPINQDINKSNNDEKESNSMDFNNNNNPLSQSSEQRQREKLEEKTKAEKERLKIFSQVYPEIDDNQQTPSQIIQQKRLQEKNQKEKIRRQEIYDNPSGNSVFSNNNSINNNNNKSKKKDLNPPKFSEEKNFQKEVLKWHNKYRKEHGSPELILEKELCEKAYYYSKKLCEGAAMGGVSTLENFFEGEILGENIFRFKEGSNVDPEKMCKEWYEEKKFYFLKNNNQNNNNIDLSLGGYVTGCGHFTQMIWKNSKKAGFGYYSINGITYAVGNYFPGGNIIGQFQQNVGNMGN